MDNLMKHAQRMQQDLQRAQEEIARLEVTGEAGAGLVKVVMTGRRDVRRVHIDPSLPLDDRGMLEDLIAAAMNDANRRIERATQERLGALTSGLGLPPGMKLPL